MTFETRELTALLPHSHRQRGAGFVPEKCEKTRIVSRSKDLQEILPPERNTLSHRVSASLVVTRAAIAHNRRDALVRITPFLKRINIGLVSTTFGVRTEEGARRSWARSGLGFGQ